MSNVKQFPVPAVVPASAPQPMPPGWGWAPPQSFDAQMPPGCSPFPPPCPPPWWGWCPPPPAPPLPPPSFTGPIIGVTDGSNANPGEVGEFVSMSVNIPYAAYPVNTSVVVSTLIVQPGDWDLYAFTEFTSAVGFVSIFLSPVPPGFSPGQLWGAEYIGPVNFQELVLQHSPGRGNFTVPTLLAMSVNVNQGTDSTLPAGTAILVVFGRRRR